MNALQQAIHRYNSDQEFFRTDWYDRARDFVFNFEQAAELGKNLDPFDLICHVAFDKKPLTRHERAENVKKRDVFTKYGPQARAVLDALLEKYRDEGVLNLDDANVLKVTPFTAMGSVVQLIKAFGGKEGFEKAVHEMQDALYQETA